MYSVGDIVVYNEEGVCRVEAVGTLKMSGIDRNQMYYTLSPLSGDGRVYVPVDTPLPMRAAISRQEALDLLEMLPAIEAEAFRLSNKRLQEEHYRELMRPHTPLALARTIKSVYEKRNGGAEKARPLSTTDEYYRKRAEVLLFQELSLALETSVEEIEAKVHERIG